MQFHTSPQGHRIAYHKTEGTGPTVVFLGGFMSDMTGSKATHFEDWAKARGQAYLRFDYSGHGASDGAFVDGTIGQWASDARSVIEATTTGDLIFVGSSMGGWIPLLNMPYFEDRMKGFVGIAAAPDFTEDGFWASFSDAQKAQLMDQGKVDVPSDYGEPYPITRNLIEEGRNNLVLRTPLAVPCPTRLFQGTEDSSVTRETALRLFDHITCEDSSMTFVQGEDHSFSTPNCLCLLTQTLDDLIAGATP